MRIFSAAFQHMQNIPSKYTCDDANINPPLQFDGFPEGTQSLALIVDDPDAPSGIFVHWLLWNIPTTINEIKENSVPENAVEGVTGFGKNGWGGPCPHQASIAIILNFMLWINTLTCQNKSPKLNYSMP